jgi:hypothetical protein
MLLIITDSKDGLSNELALLIGEQAFFRFNVDLWYEYNFEINNDYWSITDPIDRRITSKQERKVLIRKPFQTFFSDTNLPKHITENEKLWTLNQIQQFVYELCLLEKYNNNVTLIDFNQPPYLSKSVQMIVGSKYFNVPNWKMFWSNKNYEVCEDFCVKSVKACAFGDGNFLFTKSIEKGSHLENLYPWFIQKTVKAEYDLTILYIKGKCFPFTLNRKQILDLDWRKEIYNKDLKWEFANISSELESDIKNFMSDLNLEFGRLDFLIDHNSNYWFLEVNENGEWGWLDEFYEFGLYEKFLSEFGIYKLNKFLRKKL